MIYQLYFCIYIFTSFSFAFYHSIILDAYFFLRCNAVIRPLDFLARD